MDEVYRVNLALVLRVLRIYSRLDIIGLSLELFKSGFGCDV